MNCPRIEIGLPQSEAGGRRTSRLLCSVCYCHRKAAGGHLECSASGVNGIARRQGDISTVVSRVLLASQGAMETSRL